MTERLVTAAAKELHQKFLEQLDTEITRAFIEGKHLAVSAFEFEDVPTRRGTTANSVRAIFLQLKPNEEPPPGRKWVVYGRSFP